MGGNISKESELHFFRGMNPVDVTNHVTSTNDFRGALILIKLPKKFLNLHVR